MQEPIEFLGNYKNPCWFERVPPGKSPYKGNVYHDVHPQREGMAILKMFE